MLTYALLVLPDLVVDAAVDGEGCLQAGVLVHPLVEGALHAVGVGLALLAELLVVLQLVLQHVVQSLDLGGQHADLEVGKSYGI